MLKIPDIPSAPRVQGILCHSALAAAIQHNQAPTSWRDAIQQARQQEKQQGLVPLAQDDTLADWCATAWTQRPRAPEEMAEVAWLTPVALRPEAPRPTVDLTPAETILDSAVPYAWFKAQDAVRALSVDAIYARVGRQDYYGSLFLTVLVRIGKRCEHHIARAINCCRRRHGDCPIPLACGVTMVRYQPSSSRRSKNARLSESGSRWMGSLIGKSPPIHEIINGHISTWPASFANSAGKVGDALWGKLSRFGGDIA